MDNDDVAAWSWDRFIEGFTERLEHFADGNGYGEVLESHALSNGVIAERVTMTMQGFLQQLQGATVGHFDMPDHALMDPFADYDPARIGDEAFDLAVAESLRAYEMERRPVVLQVAPLVRSADAEVDQCSICMEGLEAGEECITLECSHAYHSVCIREWACHRTSCPVCRIELPVGPADMLDMLTLAVAHH